VDAEALRPGKLNAITDVPGVLVGQVESAEAPYLTGTTVVYAPGTALASVDVRGGAPGTRETDALSPSNANAGVNAIVLTGGSAYGLDTASGVMAWLAERGEGVRIGAEPLEVVPIVPAAVVFDLGRGGGFAARPTADWGRRAIEAATAGPVAQGNVGAGTGSRAWSLKGGVGTASTMLPDGSTVGAIVVVNAAGSALAPDNRLLGAAYGLDGEFGSLRAPSEAPPPPPPIPDLPAPEDITGRNTVIAVLATDAPLDKAALHRLAMVGHDGIARAVDPTHTLVDGDTVFAMSTAPAGSARWSINDRTRLLPMMTLLTAGARTLSRAIAHGMLAASSVRTPAGEIPAYREAFPSAVQG
jgi:L-aminopeptidase/D-esterase-like protein